MSDVYDDEGPLDSEHEPLPEDTEALLDHLAILVAEARQMPLSASVMINREEFAELVDAARDALPEELRQARFLLREREEFLDRARREAAQIIDAAQVQAGRMVERTEVVREARLAADRILDEAKDEAGQLRSEADDYVDQKLAAFEVVLERTMATVQKGRERLQLHTASPQLEGPERDQEVEESAFFDQDEL